MPSSEIDSGYSSGDAEKMSRGLSAMPKANVPVYGHAFGEPVHVIKIAWIPCDGDVLVVDSRERQLTEADARCLSGAEVEP